MNITVELPTDLEATLDEAAARHDAETVRRLFFDVLTPTQVTALRRLATQVLERIDAETVR